MLGNFGDRFRNKIFAVFPTPFEKMLFYPMGRFDANRPLRFAFRFTRFGDGVIFEPLGEPVHMDQSSCTDLRAPRAIAIGPTLVEPCAAYPEGLRRFGNR
jgi:hypothetical protein